MLHCISKATGLLECLRWLYGYAPFGWMYSTRSPSRVRFLIWPSVTRSNCRSSSVRRVITANLAPKEPTCKQRGC